MSEKELKKKVLAYDDWEFWAERPFGAFVLSMFKDGNTRQFYKRLGLSMEWPAMIFQDGAFYKSQKVWDIFARQLEKYITQGHTFFEITEKAEKFYKANKKNIQKLAGDPKPTVEKIKILKDIFSEIICFVWLTHGFEHLYLKKLRKEVPKFVEGDVEKFIGDISFPSKKNAHTLLELQLRGSADINAITKEYAWIKCRDGFSSMFTEKDMLAQRKKLQSSPAPHWKRPRVPNQLKELAVVAQELVYFRTFRTDMLYEFMYLSRPILKTRARELGVTFESLRDFSLEDIISGKLKPYPYPGIAVSYDKHFVLLKKPVLKTAVNIINQVKGTTAYLGRVSGQAKIVKVASEIGKVKKGDVLVAPTTFPSFIMGMKLASAFVTDEGGITSHAAIVARELHKPCVIGTKIATRIFKDGDMVEVDANTGIVKKL